LYDQPIYKPYPFFRIFKCCFSQNSYFTEISEKEELAKQQNEKEPLLQNHGHGLAKKKDRKKR